ncbi:sulfite exporter TauE/SafE family protein [Brachybacterium hainanense]|uniref:Probable membrane transporter protein n=1 Tax=Brachybacterium hainanense TaxID=1541174 RepID=A0ABV6R7I8_9MICO
MMDPLSLVVLLVLGTLAGMINAAVGSGSLLTLPVLLALGIPPGTAVRTNTLGIVFSTIGSVVGFRREIRAEGRALLPLVLVTFVCAAAGSVLLLVSPSEALEKVVPILIVLALVLVVGQPWLTRRLAARRARREAAGEEPSAASPYAHPGMLAAMGGAAVYGGYFTAAQGILYMGILATGTGSSMVRINPVKNLLSLVVNVTAALVYLVAHLAFGAEILWLGAAAIAVGALIGGYAGAHVAKRLPDIVLRGAIVVVALVALARQMLG